jgi:hypothetical protein
MSDETFHVLYIVLCIMVLSLKWTDPSSKVPADILKDSLPEIKFQIEICQVFIFC